MPKCLLIAFALALSCGCFSQVQAADWRLIAHDSNMTDKGSRDTRFAAQLVSPAGVLYLCEGAFKSGSRPHALSVACFQTNATLYGYNENYQFAYSPPVIAHDNGWDGFYEGVWALDGKTGRVQLCHYDEGCVMTEASQARKLHR